MKNLIKYLWLVVFCNLSLLSYAARFSEEVYEDPYSYSAVPGESYDFFSNEFAIENPSDLFPIEEDASPMVIMAIDPNTCPHCYSEAQGTGNPPDSPEFSYAFNMCMVNDNINGTNFCKFDPSLPVGNGVYLLLLLAVCYGIYKKRKTACNINRNACNA